MPAEDMPPPFALYRMITGFYVARAIYVVVRLGVADMLGDGPRDAEELAQQSKTHAPSLTRVLRLLVTAGIFTEDSDGRFARTSQIIPRKQRTPATHRRRHLSAAHRSI
jgi:DNA-binding IclR family transcriptional regulator